MQHKYLVLTYFYRCIYFYYLYGNVSLIWIWYCVELKKSNYWWSYGEKNYFGPGSPIYGEFTHGQVYKILTLSIRLPKYHVLWVNLITEYGNARTEGQIEDGYVLAFCAWVTYNILWPSIRQLHIGISCVRYHILWLSWLRVRGTRGVGLTMSKFCTPDHV